MSVSDFNMRFIAALKEPAHDSVCPLAQGLYDWNSEVSYPVRSKELCHLVTSQLWSIVGHTCPTQSPSAEDLSKLRNNAA